MRVLLIDESPNRFSFFLSSVGRKNFTQKFFFLSSDRRGWGAGERRRAGDTFGIPGRWSTRCVAAMLHIRGVINDKDEYAELTSPWWK